MNIQCFIFSWKGQYENAVNIESEIIKLGIPVVVINSDDKNTKSHWITLTDEDYFSDQFNQALSLFDTSKYDCLWHIQADAFYDNWQDILLAAKHAYEEYNWGIYAPNVDDTFYISSRTDVFPLDNNKMVVGTTDNTCWFITSFFINELKQMLYIMEDNKLGWGWDLLLCGLSHLHKRYVIRDYNYTVSHPKSTGYKKDQAEKEMIDMFMKCPEKLKEVISYMKTDPKKISRLYNRYQEQNFIYNTNKI